MPDFRFADHGSVTLLTPVTDAALDWVAENLSIDRTNWGPAIVIEPRYAVDILDGLQGDGLTVEG
ncbi:MAG: hypothetical protein WC829_14285 [Hyphomicrobium sp.]|jgi:hypothetical protein